MRNNLYMYVCLFLVLTVFSATAWAQDMSVFSFPNDKVKDQVLAGEVIVLENERGMLGGVGLALIDAKPKDVWRVVIDYEGHPNYLPSITKSVPTYTGDNQLDLYTEYETPWPFKPIQMNSKVEHIVDQNGFYQMSWNAYETNLEKSFGNWRVFPYQGKSLLAHEMNFEIPFVPNYAAAGFSRRAIKHVIEKIREKSLVQPTM